jgi:hypothetical protein
MTGSRQWSFFVNVTLLSLSGSGCSDGRDPFVLSSSSERIIGGSIATESEFPAVVALGGCTGTLVHPQLVVYAAHCGTAISSVRFGIDSDAPEREVNTVRCRAFPGATLGDGTDLAYCVLDEPVRDVEPERLLAGCELDQLSVSQPAIIVGYGKDSDEGAYGVKRFARSRIEAIGDEIFLEPGSTDTCRGDSGGPVFVDHIDPDGTLQRRLVGVTSAGTESECGRGITHYVNLIPKLDWLESASQLDLTPCFDQGTWAPNGTCRVTGTGDPDVLARPLLTTCGDPFEAFDDAESSTLAWVSPMGPDVRLPVPSGANYAELELAVDATDAGWGVEHVEFSLLASDGSVLFQRGDEIAPYGLPTFRVPPGRFTLLAEARDFAGNTASEVVSLQVGDELEADDELRWTVTGGGCASMSRVLPAPRSLPPALALLIAFIALRRRKHGT